MSYFLVYDAYFYPELAQNNQSSPPWKALSEGPIRYHDCKYIPKDWTWIKPHEANQEDVLVALKQWVCEQAAGKPGLVFFNVHGSATGVSDKGKGKDQQVDQEDESTSEDGDGNSEENEPENEPKGNKSVPTHFSRNNKRKGDTSEDFSESELHSFHYVYDSDPYPLLQRLPMCQTAMTLPLATPRSPDVLLCLGLGILQRLCWLCLSLLHPRPQLSSLGHPSPPQQIHLPLQWIHLPQPH